MTNVDIERGYTCDVINDDGSVNTHYFTAYTNDEAIRESRVYGKNRVVWDDAGNEVYRND